MGRNLEKWASRICPIYLSGHILTQRVFTILARCAIDHEAKVEGNARRSVSTVSRYKVALEIYGEVVAQNPKKVSFLDRPIGELKKVRLIQPIGKKAAKGHTQEYYLAVDEAMADNQEYLKQYFIRTETEQGELDRAIRRCSGFAGKIRPDHPVLPE